MRVRLNSQSVTMAVGDGGFKKWTTFTEGEWSGRLGHGVVVVSKKSKQNFNNFISSFLLPFFRVWCEK